jgi:hypothetical protein
MKYGDQELQELEEFFKSATLPDSIELFASTVITNVPAFVHSHMQIAKAKKGVMLFEPFYDRLVLLKEKLTEIG